MIETLFAWISRFHRRMFGSTELTNLEQLCLDAWRQSLDGAERDVLDVQLGAVEMVQRQAAGAKVCFIYRSDAPPLQFGNRDPDLHVADVVLKSRDESSAPSMKVKLYVHRGHFFSIEFPKRPHRYTELHHMDERTLHVDKVVLHQPL